MRFLLDTHAVLWAATGDERLPETVARKVSAPDAKIYYSAVSGYEMALAHKLDRWPEAASVLAAFDSRLAAAGWIELPLLASHGVMAGAFSMTHRDPFDRMLAAQAICEDLTLVSKDAAIDQFGVRRAW